MASFPTKNEQRLAELEALNEQLEHRIEILFGAHSLIEVGMRALIENNELLRTENAQLRAMASYSQDGIE